jgi:hypothetical protein
MAFGNSTFSNASSAVNDLLQGEATRDGLYLKAQGTRITATGTRLQATGNRVEGDNYDLAAALAAKNAEYTRESTAVQQTMADRQIYLGIGAARTAIAGSGFAESGSAVDLMRDSATQGALQKHMIERQGEITEAGYDEQAQSYTKLASYARYAATVQDSVAVQQDQIAASEERLGDQAQRNGRTMAIVHGIAAVGSLFTGGISLPGGDGESNPSSDAYGSNPFTPYGTRNPAYDTDTASGSRSGNPSGVYGSNPLTPYGTRNPAYD